MPSLHSVAEVDALRLEQMVQQQAYEEAKREAAEARARLSTASARERPIS